MIDIFYAIFIISGRVLGIDKYGQDNDGTRLTEYNAFFVGRPIPCHDHFYEGYIDDLVLWEYPLSQEEIFNVFANSGKTEN